MNRRSIDFGRIWISDEARRKLARINLASHEHSPADYAWPPPDDAAVEIEPSKFVEGGLWIWWRGVRIQIPPEEWSIDQ